MTLPMAWMILVWTQPPSMILQGSDTAILGPSPTPISSVVKKPKEEIDLHDVWNRSFRKNGERKTDLEGIHPAIVPAAGYTMATGFAAVVSANLTLASKTGNNSTILASVAYTEKRQTIIPFQSTFWADKDRYMFISDLRFMNYPSTTFGLGSHSPISAGDTIDFNYVKLHAAVLRRFARNVYGGIGFYYDKFWNIQETAPPSGSTSGLHKYGFTPTSISSGPVLRMIYDSRGNPVAPDHGWFISVTGRSNLRTMGSDTDWHSLTIEARKYFRFPSNSKNVLALWSYNVFTLAGRPPYLMLPSTGWDDFYNTGRGYVQGRYRGRNMAYLEAEYRFRISRDGLFGGVAFGNLQSFSKNPTRQLQTVIPGGGIGLRIKLNKYSGANLCVDYGWGMDGQRGISVNLGEVF